MPQLDDDRNTGARDKEEEVIDKVADKSVKCCCAVIVIPFAILVNVMIWVAMCGDLPSEEGLTSADSVLTVQDSLRASKPETEASSGPVQQPAPVSTWAVVRSVDEASGTENRLGAQ